MKVRNLMRGEEKKHLELLNLCFSPWGDEEKWKRFYELPESNPYENVLVIEESGELIGGVTAWFREAFLKQGTKVKVYVAADGFVHPAHRGKGVFSTFMQSANAHAKRKGACLGLGFISVYDTPFIALPKYGFVDIFHPETKILALHPEKFLNHMVKRVREISIPKRFEDIALKLTVSFNLLGKQQKITRVYRVNDGKLSEVQSKGESGSIIDLWLETDINTLTKVIEYFYLKRRKWFLTGLIAFLTGHLRFRLSASFVQKVLRF